MEATRRAYLPLSRIDWRLAFGFIALNTVCLFFYRQLDYVANGVYRSPLLTFLEETVGGLAGIAVFPLVYQAAIHFPLPSPRWRRYILAHLASVCLISLVHTSLIVLFRALLLPLFGFPHISYGYVPVRYLMEFAHLFIYYWVVIGLIYLFHEIRFAREREIVQAELEARLTEAQLQNLRLQLEPHFLFNALNAISAVIYEDARTADEMLGRLSELLRHLLRSERAQQIPLAREIELLKLYLSIMEARFEHRLHVRLEIEEGAAQALIPQLILQPLVENAIRHGMNPRTFHIDIVVCARREADALVLTVRDHGPGIDACVPPVSGIGLQNTRGRLERLYGNRHAFTTRNAEGGGFLATLSFPFQQAESVPPPDTQVLPSRSWLVHQ